MPTMFEIPSTAWLDGACASTKDQIRRHGGIVIAGKHYAIDVAKQNVERERSHADNCFLSALESLFARQDRDSRRLSQVLFPSPPGTQAFRNAEGRLYRFMHCEHGQTLSELVGSAGCKRILVPLLESMIPGEGGRRSLYEVDRNVIAILEAEDYRAGRARTHMNGLLAADLTRGVYAERLTPPPPGDEPVQRAINWILGATHSRDTAAATVSEVLAAYGNADLLSIDVLDALHRTLAPAAADLPPRGPSLGADNYPCQEIGHTLLRNFLLELQRTPPPASALPGLLLGATLGFHGYADGNGRLARTLYALAQLRTGEFDAPAIAAENALSGLD